MPLSNIDAYIPLLSLLRQNGCSAPYVWLLNNSPYSGVETKAFLKELKSNGLATGELKAYSFVAITSKGLAELAQYNENLEKHRAKEAKEEKQQRFENKLLIANLLVPLITFILGIVVEHWTGLANWFVSLIH